MGFANVPQWQRHLTAIQADTNPVKMVCARCGIELPLSTLPGTIVLTKEDRLFLGDDPRATNCTMRKTP